MKTRTILTIASLIFGYAELAQALTVDFDTVTTHTSAISAASISLDIDSGHYGDPSWLKDTSIVGTNPYFDSSASASGQWAYSNTADHATFSGYNLQQSIYDSEGGSFRNAFNSAYLLFTIYETLRYDFSATFSGWADDESDQFAFQQLVFDSTTNPGLPLYLELDEFNNQAGNFAFSAGDGSGYSLIGSSTGLIGPGSYNVYYKSALAGEYDSYGESDFTFTLSRPEDRSSSVPDNGSTAAMATLGLLCLASFSRRFQIERK